MRCRHCGVPIIPSTRDDGWWHDRGEGDPVSPYLNCQWTTIAEPPSGKRRPPSGRVVGEEPK